MAAAFRSLDDVVLQPTDSKMEGQEQTMVAAPSTPRPGTAPPPVISESADDAKTPTTSTFNAALASQKPLPSSPFPQNVQIPQLQEKPVVRRADSQHSGKSADSDDVDMDESEGETAPGEEGVGSDDESGTEDPTGLKNKKKSQRFYCTDYPPCNLSFTRSEHLARHIRSEFLHRQPRSDGC
jgi:C2H2 transcription facotor